MQISLGTTNNQATFLHFRECAKYLAHVGHFRSAGKEERQSVLLEASPAHGRMGGCFCSVV